MYKLLSVKFLLIVAVNILVAVGAAILLGNSVGWMSATRAGEGTMVGDVLPFIQFIAFAAIADYAMWSMASRDQGAEAGTRVPRLALQIGTFLIYAVILAAGINLVFRQSMAAILGASGVVGLVLGFALRGLLSDVFYGIALQLDRSISMGDWLDFQYRGRDMSGKLQEIAWRTVVFADRSENIVLIPNGEFASLVITNRSRPTPLSEYGSSIDLGAEHDEARIRAILQGAVNRAAFDNVLAESPAPYVRISSIKDGVITFRMLYCLNVGSISPIKVNHVVLVYAVQFLKAAGIPVTHMVHTDVGPPATTGQHHIDQPQARLTMLSSVGFFSILPPADLATVAVEAETLRLPAGHQLLIAGESGDSMFAVSEGSLEVTIDGPEGPVLVGRLWPGDYVGEMQLFTGAPRSAHVRTAEPTVLFKIQKQTMAGIFAHNPSLIVRIAEMIDGREKKNESALHQTTKAAASHTEAASIVGSIRRFFHL
ncbi:MAG: mechanosensitive ion channel family protein [Aeromicrobium sp.]|nr:mechanosensitive ion channel family protein [Burkholderiales bacterium]